MVMTGIFSVSECRHAPPCLACAVQSSDCGRDRPNRQFSVSSGHTAVLHDEQAQITPSLTSCTLLLLCKHA